MLGRWDVSPYAGHLGIVNLKRPGRTSKRFVITKYIKSKQSEDPRK